MWENILPQGGGRLAVCTASVSGPCILQFGGRKLLGWSTASLQIVVRTSRLSDTEFYTQELMLPGW